MRQLHFKHAELMETLLGMAIKQKTSKKMTNFNFQANYKVGKLQAVQVITAKVLKWRQDMTFYVALDLIVINFYICYHGR